MILMRRWRKLCFMALCATASIIFITNHTRPEESLDDLVDPIITTKAATKKNTEDDFAVEAVMIERRRNLREACWRLKTEKEPPNVFEYLVNKKAKVVWCSIFKSGSSSWYFLMNQLAGISAEQMTEKKQKRKPLSTLARNKYPRPSVEDVLMTSAEAGSTSFVVGRHPFQRLVSGYKDKILGAINKSPHDKLAFKILKQYREPDKVPKIKKRYKKGEEKPRPTFEEFSKFVLDSDEFDMHWTPAVDFCGLCELADDIDFDLVLFETFQRDQNYILGKIGVVLDKLKIEIVNPSEQRLDKMGVKSELSHKPYEEYVNELSEDVLQGLCRLYQLDFAAFGYTWDNCDFSST